MHVDTRYTNQEEAACILKIDFICIKYWKIKNVNSQNFAKKA
jgi:hypothetical protein